MPAKPAKPAKPATVRAYLASLPADRRAALNAVRKVILANLDTHYEEGMQYGGIGYFVPHRVYPDGYHCDPRQPLPFAGLGSNKRHMSFGMMCLYRAPRLLRKFQKAWEKTGKRLDMGKVCIRFKRPEDLALDVIAATIRAMPARKYIRHYEATMKPRTGRSRGARKTARRS